MDKNDSNITATQQMLSSCTGAIITSIFVTPLDVVKIRIQAQQKEFMKNKCFLYCNGLMDHICYCNGNGFNIKNVNNLKNLKWFNRPVYFKGTLDGIFKIAKSEGITSLWSGLPPTLVMAVPATVVYFTFYDKFKLELNKKLNFDKQPYWVPMLSGGIARLISAFLISPLEMIRTKMQSKKLSYCEVNIAIKQMIENEGKLALYKGLWPTILRDVPFSSIYWVNYEYLMNKLNKENKRSISFSFISGAISGMIAAAITLPFDVVKTHKQIELGEKLMNSKEYQNKTTNQIMINIYKKNGIKGLFAGLTPRIIKVMPACAIMISTYEFGKSFFNSLNESKNYRSIKTL